MSKRKFMWNELTALATSVGSIIVVISVVAVTVSPAAIQRVDSLVDPVNELSRPIAPIAISGVD
jgi:predicted PurR-regulated permease PerM